MSDDCPNASYDPSDTLRTPDLEKLPKGSSCQDRQQVPARSSYWRDETESVERCSSFDTSGKGSKRRKKRDSGDDLPEPGGWELTEHDENPLMVVWELKHPDNTAKSPTNLSQVRVAQIYDDYTVEYQELSEAASRNPSILVNVESEHNSADSALGEAGDVMRNNPSGFESWPPHEDDSSDDRSSGGRRKAAGVTWPGDENGYEPVESKDKEMLAWAYVGGREGDLRLYVEDKGEKEKSYQWSRYRFKIEGENVHSRTLKSEDDPRELSTYVESFMITNDPDVSLPVFEREIENAVLKPSLDALRRDSGSRSGSGKIITHKDNSNRHESILLAGHSMAATEVRLSGGKWGTVAPMHAAAVSYEDMWNAAQGSRKSEEARFKATETDYGWRLTYAVPGGGNGYSRMRHHVDYQGLPRGTMQDKFGGPLPAITTTGREFKRMVDALRPISNDGETVVVEINGETAVFYTENDAGERAKATFQNADVNLEPSETVRVPINLGSLRDLAIPVPKPASTKIMLAVAEDAGIEFTYVIEEDDADVTAHVRRIVAKQKEMPDYDLSQHLEAAGCPVTGDDWELGEPLEPGTEVPPEVAEHLDFGGDTIMWFFPNSDGCRCGTQAQQFSALAEEMDVTVYGVAKSPLGDLQEMGGKLDLSIDLISDPDAELAEAFGVEETDAGLERKTFFVRNGRVTDVSSGVMSAALEQPPAHHREKETASDASCGFELDARSPGIFAGPTQDLVGPTEYIHGDHDNDTIPNVDDRNPFKAGADDAFYQEISLSDDVLGKAEQIAQAHREVFDAVVSEFDIAKGRVKQPVSILEKLLRKHVDELTDIIGVTVYADDHQGVLDLAQRIEREYDVVKAENYIADPKNDVYYAYHVVFEWPEAVIDGDEIEVEMQIKTEEEAKLHSAMHEAYKQGENMAQYEKRANELARTYGTSETGVDNDAEHDPRPTPEDDALNCPLSRYPEPEVRDLNDEWVLQSTESEQKLVESLDHPGIYVITGQRGAGKSALAMRTGELIAKKHGAQPVTVGMPVAAREHFPDNWQHVRYVHDAPGDSVLIVDEAYMNYHSRESMSEENKNLGKLINTSRHCGNTMLFVSQNSSYIEKNTVSEADALLAKEPGKMQMQFERMQVRSISQNAKEQFNALPENEDNRAYVYMYGDNYEGMVQNDLPGWYNDEISKSFKALCDRTKEETKESMEGEAEQPAAEHAEPAD